MRQADEPVADCETHLIHIYPDPSKSPQEVKDATNVIQAMYGEGWNKVYLVRVGDRFVFMFGSDHERLVQTIEHVKKGLDPIGQSAALQKPADSTRPFARACVAGAIEQPVLRASGKTGR